jgi:conserved oligomeric Golgi complex subunit 5
MVLDVASEDQVAQAAATLQLLFHQDTNLVRFGLTDATSTPDQVAYPYAASLLEQVGQDIGIYSSTHEKADLALRDVERKLALAESLSLKLSRTSPETVAGHLLRLYGYNIPSPEVSTTSTCNLLERATTPILTSRAVTKTSLVSIRERSDRLERQAEILETVARRIENSLLRGNYDCSVKSNPQTILHAEKNYATSV